MILIYDFSDYKEWLKEEYNQRFDCSRGFKSYLSRVTGCQPAYISNIFSGKAQLSLEQAEKISFEWGLASEEANYFFLLINKDRSGNYRLRSFFNKEIELIRKEKTRIKNVIKTGVELNKEHQYQYYSSWHYGAIHMATVVSDLDTASAISEKLKISIKRVSEVLNFLDSVGLVKMAHGKVRALNKSVYLHEDSSLISSHHSNWRSRALQELQCINDDSLHYSSVVSLGNEDLLRVKKMLISEIKKIRECVKESSPEEIMAVINIDFFEL